MNLRNRYLVQKFSAKLQAVKKHLVPKNVKVLYLSIVLSTMLPLLVAYWAYPTIFSNQMQYSDLVVGATTWSGYYKNGDMWLFFIFISMYILMLFLTPLLLNLTVKKSNDTVPDNNSSYSELFIMSSIAIGVTIFTITKVLPVKIVIAIGFFYLIHYLIKGKSDLYSSELYAKLCLLGIFAYFDIIAINNVSEMIFRDTSFFSNSNYNYMLMFIMLIIVSLTMEGKTFPDVRLEIYRYSDQG